MKLIMTQCFFLQSELFKTTYGGSTATVIEFKNFMEAQSGLNFTQFFNQWYYGQGYPTFSVSWNQGQTVCFI
jgi:aminopeptidase N